MSSPTTDANHPPTGRAEKAFRDAFDRLKQNRPTLLPRGTKVTQNNVAREAGVDPSALRRGRFPQLIQEIQAWIGQSSDTQDTSRAVLDGRAKRRALREQLAAIKSQRDDALARLVDAEAMILDLTMDIERLKALQPASNILPIRRGKS